MELTKRFTSRGFGRIEFKDKYGAECSIQESSAADTACLWIGCNAPNPRHMVDGHWVEVKLPPDTVSDTRMHLTIDQVKELIPILQKWVDTDQLIWTDSKDSAD